jgi:hypothetical protein
MRLFLTIGWRLLMLEGRAHSDAAHVLGWPIVRLTPTTAVLRRRSLLGIDATLVFTVDAHASTFESGMAFSNRLARLIWVAIAPTHKWATRVVLASAAAQVR